MFAILQHSMSRIWIMRQRVPSLMCFTSKKTRVSALKQS